ncbi:hypothetical protein CR513_08779, partial [Mucuna pruriens]
MEKRIEWERPKFQPCFEELKSINLGNDMEKREVKVDKQMPLELQASLVELLREYTDMFAWSYQDMPGLDRAIVKHKLPLLPDYTPVH